MYKVIFSFEQDIIEIQSNENDIMENICSKYANKIQRDLQSLYFVYSGTILDLKLKLKNVINNYDKQNKCMQILVYEIGTINLAQENIIKSKQIICPKCSENAFIKFENYKIKLICNKCSENTLLISEYENTQKIEQSKIICGICKQKNKAETFQNQFLRCLDCKINICPLCKSAHNQKHNIIDYDYKSFICEEHYEKYEFFCKTCKKNLCTECVKFHNKHETIIFGNIIPDKEDINKNLEKFKQIKDYFIVEVKDIIKKLEKVMDNLNILYRQNEELVNYYFDLKQNKKFRNYEMIINLNYFNPEENDVIKDLEEVMNDDTDKINEAINILNIYYKMETKDNYDEDNINFKNLIEESNILRKICLLGFGVFSDSIELDEIIQIFKPFKRINEDSLLSLISTKFKKNNLPMIMAEFVEFLNKLDLYDEYKKEIITKFSCNTKQIFNSKYNENSIINFMTKVYGKNNLACFISFTSKEKEKEEEKITKNKNLFFLNGKFELNNKEFDFNKTDVFLYGNFEHYEDSDYGFESYKNQNTNIFAKIKDGLIYVVVYRKFTDIKIGKVLKIQNNYMKDKIIYVIDNKFFEILERSLEKNKSFDNVDELFENFDNSLKCEAELKELIIYQIENKE